MKIYKFDPVIYPIPLLVCKASKDMATVLDRHFWAIDENNDEIVPFTTDFSISEGVAATTLRVVAKKDKRAYSLVVLNRINDSGVGIIAHESLHVANNMGWNFSFPPNNSKNDEPYAYLIEWCANCIDSVLKNKTDSMNGQLMTFTEK